MEGSETYLHVRSRRYGATRCAIKRVARIVTKAVPLDIVVWTGLRSLNRQNVRGGVVGEGDGTRNRDGESDVRAVLYAPSTVVKIPAFVDGDFAFIIADRN